MDLYRDLLRARQAPARNVGRTSGDARNPWTRERQRCGV